MNWLHDFWQFLNKILGVSLVQELVVTAPSISETWRRSLSVLEAQVVLEVRVFLTSVSFASRGKNGLFGHVKIIMVGHD